MKKFFASILVGISFFVIADQIVKADDLSNPGVFPTNATNILTEGYFDVVDTTQLVFIAGTATNVLDPDITSP